MTFEARLAFIVFFFLCWTVVALFPWAVSAVVVRGRGAILALPMAIVAAWAAGVLVPVLGMRDAGGFFLSLGTAFLAAIAGSIAGLSLARRMGVDGPRPGPPPRARLDS